MKANPYLLALLFGCAIGAGTLYLLGTNGGQGTPSHLLRGPDKAAPAARSKEALTYEREPEGPAHDMLISSIPAKSGAVQVEQTKPAPYDKRTPLEKVADGCDLDRQRLKELSELDPDVTAAIQRTNELFNAAISLSSYFARECARLRDGQPSVPLADELRATIDPMSDEMYAAAELADACIRPHILNQDLTAEQFVWIIERGGCMEALRGMIETMAFAEMSSALERHSDR